MNDIEQAPLDQQYATLVNALKLHGLPSKRAWRVKPSSPIYSRNAAWMATSIVAQMTSIDFTWVPSNAE